MSVPATAVLVAALAAACAGCARRASGTLPEGPPVEYVRRNFRSSLAGCVDPATGAPIACVHIAVDYVEATRATTALANAVTWFVRATALQPVPGLDPPPDVETLRDDLYDRYRALQRDDPDYAEPWRVERTVSVACNTPGVQGLIATERSFTGEEEGIARVTYGSFATGSGDRLGLDALVSPENLGPFLEVLEHRARAARVVARADVFDRSGAVASGGGLGEPDQVLICPEALRFRWAAEGSLEVEVPRDAVRELLRADAP